MDEFIAFVFIWIVLYVVNMLSKKLKQKPSPVQKPASAPSVPAKQTPPETAEPKKELNLKELFEELTKERSETPPPPAYRDEDAYSRDKQYSGQGAYQTREIQQEEQELEDNEELFEEEQESIEKDEEIAQPPADTLVDERAKSTLSETLKQIAVQKRIRSVNQSNLRQAIIWKEILDKPLSLRFPLQSRNRLS
jgi:hypothetical protein